MPTSGEIITKTSAKEYVISRLTYEKLADLASLHAAVYGTKPEFDYFPRKYDTAYTGAENVGFVAYSKQGLPVAYYGVIPCFIQYGNKIILAAQSADTMTHPSHRYKGMFVELSNMTFELCRQLGILLVFGFPNQNSYHGAINKLGWQMTGTMACFVIPVNSLPLQLLSGKAVFLKKLYKRYTKYILGEKVLPLKGIGNSAHTDGFAGVCRNPEYLTYKNYNPTKVIGISEVKVWLSNKYGLVIGDMEGVNKDNFSRVLKSLERLAKKMGIRQIQFHGCPGTTLYELFAEKYEPVPSYPMLFQDFGSAISPEKIRFTFADIDIF
jgi:hypothetical protein